MEITNILFTSAVLFWFIAIIILITIQQSMKARHGVYTSMMEDLDRKQIKKAKASGYLFLFGAVLLIVGFILKSNL